MGTLMPCMLIYMLMLRLPRLLRQQVHAMVCTPRLANSKHVSSMGLQHSMLLLLLRREQILSQSLSSLVVERQQSKWKAHQ